MEIGRVLILLGVILIAAGLLVNFLPNLRPPLLPGDIFIQRGNFTFYFPIVTSILISILLTIIVNFFK